MYKKLKDGIDNMTQEQMAILWRFGDIGNSIFIGETGEYFTKVFKDKGGMTPEISKKIGWKL